MISTVNIVGEGVGNDEGDSVGALDVGASVGFEVSGDFVGSEVCGDFVGELTEG